MRTPILVLFSFALASAATAQVQRTFVASSGVDTNPCSRSAPCRTFAAAIAATLTGGEVVVLDSAGYGPVTITQGVSIVAPAGVYAGISAFSGNAITVNAPLSDTVVLRGLTAVGLGASYGIDVMGSSRVHVESCVMSGFSAAQQAGLYADGTAIRLWVDDSKARGNYFGFFIGSGVDARVDRTRADQDGFGFAMSATGTSSTLTIANSEASFNNSYGAYASVHAKLDIHNCVFAGNPTAVAAGSGAVAAVGGSMFSMNSQDLVNTSATFYSFGNNESYGAASPDSGTITPIGFK